MFFKHSYRELSSSSGMSLVHARRMRCSETTEKSNDGEEEASPEELETEHGTSAAVMLGLSSRRLLPLLPSRSSVSC